MIATCEPSDQAWFAAVMELLGPWPAARRVGVAVSGGADSLCLAWLAAGWGKPIGLIVDHGLRRTSTAEALEAANRLSGFGMPSRILTLQLRPGAALAARARGARYAALSGAASEMGLSDLLLGHHARDQAETVLIRRQSHSGPAGLAGMAAIVEIGSVRLVRPLLATEPDRLRAILRMAALDWTEDPSNADPRAGRTRARHVLTDYAATDRLVHEAGCFATARAAREIANATTLAQRATLFPEGYGRLTEGPIPSDCLAALVRSLAGALYPASGKALTRLAAELRPCTLGGVRLMRAGRLGAGWLLVREAAAMQRSVAAADGVRWDGRFELQADGNMPAGATLGALGQDARLVRHLTRLPSAVLCTLPALRAPVAGADHLALAVPHLGYFNGWTNRRVRLTLSPPNPVAGAPFAVVPLGDVQCVVEPHVLDEAPPSRPD